jgi:hypothetical protein
MQSKKTIEKTKPNSWHGILTLCMSATTHRILWTPPRFQPSVKKKNDIGIITIRWDFKADHKQHTSTTKRQWKEIKKYSRLRQLKCEWKTNNLNKNPTSSTIIQRIMCKIIHHLIVPQWTKCKRLLRSGLAKLSCACQVSDWFTGTVQSCQIKFPSQITHITDIKRGFADTNYERPIIESDEMKKSSNPAIQWYWYPYHTVLASPGTHFTNF